MTSSLRSCLAGAWSRSPLAPAGAGAGVGPVSLDHRDEEIEQQLAFVRCERCEDAVIGGAIAGPQACEQSLPFGRETQEPRAAILAIHAALDDPFADELLDQKARVVAIDPEAGGEAVLVDARLAGDPAEIGEHAPLQRRELGLGDRVRDHRHADLVETSRQRRGDPQDRWRARSRWGRRLGCHHCGCFCHIQTFDVQNNDTQIFE